MNSANTPLLDVRNLSIDFTSERGVVRAVDGISFSLEPGDTVGLVGESGCGKSITSLSILGLVPSPPGRISTDSQIMYKGQNLVGLSDKDYRKIRGSEISMIFQEPMTALNPVFTIANQMEDVLIRHKRLRRREARKKAIEMLDLVGIPAPDIRIRDYPHQLSGGMRQRVMIAMALSCDPSLLLADEPTTALDVTVQAQVMEQMRDLQEKRGMATILVTHDLAVIAEFCKKVIVMYCGRIVEVASVTELFTNPRHPYTRGLLNSIPRIRQSKLDVLPTIPGTVPDLHQLPHGCRFLDRCDRATDRCHEQVPPLESFKDSVVACNKPLM